MTTQRFVYPRWTNKFLALIGVLIAGGGAYAGVLFLGATSPVTLNTKYRPTQPVPFSHALHAGQLKMDCRYCHNSVDKSAHSSIPPTQTCVNCHSPKTAEGGRRLCQPSMRKAKNSSQCTRVGEQVSRSIGCGFTVYPTMCTLITPSTLLVAFPALHATAVSTRWTKFIKRKINR